MSIGVYAMADSVAQGGSIDFCGSSTPPSALAITVLRAGPTDEILLDDVAMADSHDLPEKADEAGCGWPVFYTLTVASDWPSGLYLARFTAGLRMAEVPFIIRSSTPGSRSRMLFQFASTTVHAYNWDSPHNLYPSDYPERHRRISLNRPLDNNPDRHYWRERKFLNWMIDAGFGFECCTSFDVHSDPSLLDNYDLFLSVGHDEYWSREMRDNVERFIRNGGNAAFFSGNTSWWQIRFEDEGRTIVCYKSAVEDPQNGVDNGLVTVQWHAAPVYRPENSLTGVSYRLGAGCWVNRDASAEKAYRVRFAAHWVFEETGLSDGDEFGLGESIIGYETDAADFEEVDDVPLVTCRDETPPSFVILATADLRDWEPLGKWGWATMGLFRRNGTVFTAASVDWANGLEFPESATRTITANVLRKLGSRALTGEWQLAGDATDIVSMTAYHGDLFAVASDNRLLSRRPVPQNIPWSAFLPATDAARIVALAAGDGINSSFGFRLYAATDDNRLLWRRLDGVSDWEDIGHANRITAMVLSQAALWAASDDRLWLRNPWKIDDLWQNVGPAIDVVAMAAIDSMLFAVTADGRLWNREPLWKDIVWTKMGRADDVIALAASGGKLFGVTRANELLWRDP
jgi:hypothetical protein